MGARQPEAWASPQAEALQAEVLRPRARHQQEQESGAALLRGAGSPRAEPASGALRASARARRLRTAACRALPKPGESESASSASGAYGPKSRGKSVRSFRMRGRGGQGETWGAPGCVTASQRRSGSIIAVRKRWASAWTSTENAGIACEMVRAIAAKSCCAAQAGLGTWRSACRSASPNSTADP